METLFRRYGWAVRLAIIAIASLLIAMIINSFIASQLAPLTVPKLPDIKKQVATEASKKAVSNKSLAAVDRVGAITTRCFFGCPEEVDPNACAEPCPEGQQCVEGACVEPQPEIAEIPGNLPVLSDLNVELVGVMVSSRPEWSSALIQDPASKQAYVVRPDEMLLGQAKVVEIKRDRIILERGGRLEFIRLKDTITGNPSAASLARAPSPPPSVPSPTAPRADPLKGIAREEEQEEQVKPLGEGKFELSRASIDSRLKNRAELVKGASIIPNYRNGKKSGLKLLNVTGNSVYNQLGFKSGDVLQAVNGEEIRSQAHAMELMDKFRESDNVKIVIERNGKRETLDYNIK